MRFTLWIFCLRDGRLVHCLAPAWTQLHSLLMYFAKFHRFVVVVLFCFYVGKFSNHFLHHGGTQHQHQDAVFLNLHSSLTTSMIVLDLSIWQIMCLFHQIIWLGFALYILRIIITLHVASENLCSIDKFLIWFILLLKDCLFLLWFVLKSVLSGTHIATLGPLWLMFSGINLSILQFSVLLAILIVQVFEITEWCYDENRLRSLPARVPTWFCSSTIRRPWEIHLTSL